MVSPLSVIVTSQDEAADTLGVDVRTFQRWLKRGCPGKPRAYVLRDCIRWARDNIWCDESDIVDEATGDPDDIKTQYLKERVEKLRRENKLADFKIDTQSERLVDAEHVQRLLQNQADVFRNGLERFERKFGSEPTTMIVDILEEVENIDFSSPAS